jgi:hypothetical protein
VRCRRGDAEVLRAGERPATVEARSGRGSRQQRCDKGNCGDNAATGERMRGHACLRSVRRRAPIAVSTVSAYGHRRTVFTPEIRPLRGHDDLPAVGFGSPRWPPTPAEPASAWEVDTAGCDTPVERKSPFRYGGRHRDHGRPDKRAPPKNKPCSGAPFVTPSPRFSEGAWHRGWHSGTRLKPDTDHPPGMRSTRLRARIFPDRPRVRAGCRTVGGVA